LYKYHIIYQIANLVNGKIYIGKHSTNDLNDSYFGSSVILKHAITKHGKDNFQKKILFIYDSVDDMNNKEKELVNENFVKSKNTYNLNTGGTGGFHYVNSSGIGKEASKKGIQSYKQRLLDPEYRNFICVQTTLNNIRYHENNNKVYVGHSHSNDSKSKIGKANKIKQKGNGNSQYGTCWIYNLDLKKNKKIVPEEIEYYLSLGWKNGRKMKF